MKPWLVAHRGASYEAKENTIKAFITAKQYPIAMIELDVRVTKDNFAIIHHDPSITGTPIATTTYNSLRVIDPELALFEQVVATVDGLPLMVELKAVGAAAHVKHYLAGHPNSYATSFIASELDELITQGIDRKRLFLAQYHHPVGLQKKAITHGFGGITVNKFYLSPLFYWQAKKHDLKLMVYTVNGLPLAWLFRKLYPTLLICTDKPRHLQKIA